MSSGKFYQIGFTLFLFLFDLSNNSLFSPNELRHILFKFFIPNILDAMPSHFIYAGQSISSDNDKIKQNL